MLNDSLPTDIVLDRIVMEMRFEVTRCFLENACQPVARVFQGAFRIGVRLKSIS